MDTNTVFAKVHRTTQKLLRELITTLMKSLDVFGCGLRQDREAFAVNIRKVMIRLADCPPSKAPLAAFELAGASLRDKRLALIKEALFGFGASKEAATALANLALSGNTKMLGKLTADGKLILEPPKVFCLLQMRISHLHGDGTRLYGRLKKLLARIDKPYRGTPLNPDAGVEQVVGMLRCFPDLADAIYAKLGFRATASFPPQAIGVAGDAERIFVKAVSGHLDARWWSDTFKLAGLIIASITITLVTAGTLGPLAATLVGSGIGLTQGVVQLGSAAHKLEQTEDAYRFGAATEQSVEFAEGELQGAWGMLVVDTATGGLMGRFGGGQSVSNLMKVVRVSTISGVGSGLATATNPNVWRSDDTTGLILFATVVGAVSGAGGHFVAAGAMRVLPKVGAKLQIGVSKLDGHLIQGRKVRVQLRVGETPVDATVVSVNRADATVTLKVEGQDLRVKVGKVVKLSGSMFHGKTFQRTLRPMTREDFSAFMTDAFLVKTRDGAVPGVACFENGKAYFKPKGDVPMREVRLEDLRVSKTGKLPENVKPPGVPKLDRQRFAPAEASHVVAPLKRNDFYYSAVRREMRCNEQPKLKIVTSMDLDPPGKGEAGAFAGWLKEDLPSFDMRGRKVPKGTPQPDEVAVFMGHGTSRGFSALSTREAARTMADAIVDTNRKFGSGSSPIRYCVLSACEQGNRRYFVVGRTNAEVFQKHLDMRLTELGINPKGKQGITVLASDRMGSMRGGSHIEKLRGTEPTTFVPAGTQRPLSYGRDLALPGVKLVALVLVGGTGIVRFVDAEDVDACLEAIERFGEYIIGAVVDALETRSRPAAPSRYREVQNY